MPWYMLIWDEHPGGNAEHLAEHGVSMDEFEEVLFSMDPQDIESSRSNPQHHTVVGMTLSGRVLRIVWMNIDSTTVLPVTAYEVYES